MLGLRDYCLLLFLYNSRARADEAARLTIEHLRLDDPPSVRIHGKGNKIRICPLWPMMLPLLDKLIIGRSADQVVFLGRANKPMTRFGIHRLVTHYAEMASDEIPSMQAKRVSPHNIRHATAVHMLRSGVDIYTIRAWLGHVSLDTTNIYAEVAGAFLRTPNRFKHRRTVASNEPQAALYSETNTRRPKGTGGSMNTNYCQ